MNCNQFEGLITFYLDDELSESLKQSFEEHMQECSACKMKYKVISSIIGDIKTAYNKIINDNYPQKADYVECGAEHEHPKYPVEILPDDISPIDLSAYVDNELTDDNNIRIRRSIVSKPKIRTKIEKLYKLKKILYSSFNEQKNKMKSDFSKEVLKNVDKEISAKEVCVHCFFFILVVILALILSVWTILRVL